MGQNQKKIIAIGGGGFTHKSDEVLDKFVIDQCKKKQINFGFLPTASEDNKDKIKLIIEVHKAESFAEEMLLELTDNNTKTTPTNGITINRGSIGTLNI